MAADKRPRCKALVPNSQYPLKSPDFNRYCGRLLPCKVHPNAR